MKIRYGFNLIELMVVMAIVALLATIALPSFFKMIAKARRAEAYMQLRALYVAEKLYYAEHGVYASALQGPESLSWKPEGELLYSYGFPGSASQQFVAGSLGASGSDLQAAHVASDGFVIAAAGDIDGDGSPDILTINEKGSITLVEDDLA